MKKKELERFDIIKSLIDGKINGTDAFKQTALSLRHIKRLKSKVLKFGIAGLAHGNRGKKAIGN